MSYVYVFQQASIRLTSTQRICVSFGNLGCWFFYFCSVNWKIAENIPYISVNMLFYGPLLWIIPHIYDTNTIILKKNILLSGYFFLFVHNVNFHSREDMTIFSEYQYLCKSIGYFHLPLPLVVYNCPDFQKKNAFKRWSIAWGGGGFRPYI